MIEGRAVCAGYAKSMQYLLNRMNIETFYVSGDVFDEGSHAWNIVEIDGDYYHVDATYGDPVTEDEHQELKYDYLCITSEEILRDRKMDSEFPLPECTNTAYNYFVMEDKYLNWLDRDKITELLINSVEAEEACIFKLSSSSDMQQLKKGLLDNDEIWDLIFQVEDYHNIDVEVYYYTLDEEMLSVKLSLEY